MSMKAFQEIMMDIGIIKRALEDIEKIVRVELAIMKPEEGEKLR